MRIAVTGAGGRLGGALMAALEESPYTGPFGPIGWGRADLDLDHPGAVGRTIDDARAELVVHVAAWTDAAGCARDPVLAERRNALATGRIAEACAVRGVDLVVVSCGEVFDGRRTDGRGYGPTGPTDPAGALGAYGASKLAGERAALAAWGAQAGAVGHLGIVRSGWLFGSPGNDLPSTILDAADHALADGIPLRLEAGPTGSPTSCADLAEGIAELIGSGDVTGVHHMVNAGVASRLGFARELLRMAGLRASIEEVQAAPEQPTWLVLEPTGMPSGEPMRTWQEALADYLPRLIRSRSASSRSASSRSGRPPR